MPEQLNDARIQGFLATKEVVVLSTIQRSGAPLAMPMWFLPTAEALYMVSVEGLQKVRNLRRDARVCVEHEGPGRVSVAGGPGIGDHADVNGLEQRTMVRLEYVEPEPRSWFPVVPEMVDRLAVARDALPGPAALPLFGLIALAVLGGSLLLVVREARG